MVCRKRRGILKKLFIWLGFLCVLFFTVAASGTEAEPGVRRIGAAVKDGVNLREESSKNAALLASLKKGEQVEILGEQTGKDSRLWYRCRYEDKTGYIREDMLAVAEITLPEDAIGNPDVQADPSGTILSWKQVYHDFILGKQYMASRDSSDPEIFSDPFGNTYDINPYKDVAFGLYDWNMDGIPELFADNGALDSGWSEALVYTCSDGQLVSLGCLSNRAGGPWVTVDPGYPGVLSMSGNMGFFTMEYTLLQGPESMAGEMVFSEDYNDPETGEPLEFPVITVLSSDTGLFSAIRAGGVIPVCQFEAGSLDESSWVDFLSVSVDTARLAMDPVSVIPDQAEIVSDQPRQEAEPGSPSEPVSTDSSHFSSAAPVLRESWDGRNMEEGNPGTFRSLLLDSMAYPGTWKETYLKILKENERAIRYHLTYYDEYSLDNGCSPGIIFRDITRDGIPEMFFIKAIPTELSGYTPDQYEGDLYVYSNNGTQTQCVISIPRFYCTDWIGSSYSVFFPILNPDRLYIQFQDPLPWQVEYNVDNRFSVESTYRFTSTDYDDDNIIHFYINGAETGESEAKSYWIEPDTADYTVITSTECTPMLSGLDFDAAVRLLADPGTDAGNVEIGYPRSGRTNRANVNVRLETNKSSQLIEQIRASDTEVAVLSVRYDSKGVLWVYVQTANGNKGYVRSDMIRIMD